MKTVDKILGKDQKKFGEDVPNLQELGKHLLNFNMFPRLCFATLL